MNGPVVPLRQFVLKVHSCCDLACDYCYVYAAADQSWRGHPAVISDELVSRAAQRIAEHAAAKGFAARRLSLMQGPPAGRPARLRRVITGCQAELQGVRDLDLRIHTKGALLSEAFCELSPSMVPGRYLLDGDRTANDRHRRFADGRGCYDKVIADTPVRLGGETHARWMACCRTFTQVSRSLTSDDTMRGAPASMVGWQVRLASANTQATGIGVEAAAMTSSFEPRVIPRTSADPRLREHVLRSALHDRAASWVRLASL
jgi:hypothetical protein